MILEGVEAYPLHWPDGWPRTSSPQRSRFGRHSRGRAVNELVQEIERIGGRYVTISTNLRLRRDGLPYASERAPDDKGVAVYFERRGRQMVYACDRWDRIEDNMRAITKSIEAIRGLERWGASEMMERAFAAFEALPAPKSCWDILGVRPGSGRDAVMAAFKERAKRMHPDHGGSTAAMAELNRARDEALAAH